MSEQPTEGPEAGWRAVWRRFRHGRVGMAGLLIVGSMFIVAFFAPLLAGNEPIVCRHRGEYRFPALVETLHAIPFTGYFIQKSAPFRRPDFDFRTARDPAAGDWGLWPPVPFSPYEVSTRPFQSPSRWHWLGTDEVGRDLMARMIHGAGVSMRVGFISMGIAAFIGIIVGAIAGYAGGWADILISRFIEIVICFPSFFLILAILAWFPPRIENIMIVIGLTSWTGIARYTRGEFLRLREMEFALAARALGASPARIVFRHLLPNSLTPVMVSVTFGVADAILTESALSWLGFGVQPPQPSWGNILRDGYDNLFTAPHMIPPSCVAIFIAVLSFNLVGDALRDAIDPRLAILRGRSRR